MPSENPKYRSSEPGESDRPHQRKLVAYLTGEYPKVSHTFISREVAALRRLGVDVETCTVRRTPAKHIVGEEQRQEAAATFCILDATRNPVSFIVDIFGAFCGSPRRWIAALALAWRTRSPGAKALVWQFFYLLEASIFAQHLRKVGATHIHNHFADSSCTVAMLASTITDIPFSFTPHGPAIFFEPKRWALDEKVARARFVICISHFARSQTMLFSDQSQWHKLHIVHCGVEPARYGRKPRPSFGKHVLFVGRLAAVKGVPLLLDAVSRLKTEHPEMRLYIIGDGPDRAKLENQARELSLNDVVTFFGNQPQDAVAAKMEEADMLVLPSFAEGVPVVLMEAMASRLPVVASRIAGTPELVDDGVSGLLVPPGDLASLTDAIAKLLSNPALPAAYGDAGRAKVEREFDASTQAVGLAHLFR